MLSQLQQFGYKFKSQARIVSSTGLDDSSFQRQTSQKRSTAGKSVGSQNISMMVDPQSGKELASKIKSLYNVCMVGFVGHVSLNANKNAQPR